MKYGSSRKKVKVEMNLEQLMKEIDKVDEDKIIFQKNMLCLDSEVELFDEGVEAGVIIKDGVKYFYLLEVFIAKEFIKDWVNSLQSKPTDEEIVKRLFDYAIKDA